MHGRHHPQPPSTCAPIADAQKVDLDRRVLGEAHGLLELEPVGLVRQFVEDHGAGREAHLVAGGRIARGGEAGAFQPARFAVAHVDRATRPIDREGVELEAVPGVLLRVAAEGEDLAVAADDRPVAERAREQMVPGSGQRPGQREAATVGREDRGGFGRKRRIAQRADSRELGGEPLRIRPRALAVPADQTDRRLAVGGVAVDEADA